MPTPNADDPLQTTDHVSAAGPPPLPITTDAQPTPEAGTATVTFQPSKGGPRDGSPAPPAVPGYEIEGVLGRGGMGVVYKARHLALKMVLAGGHAGAHELARFRIEAEAVARLQHPNIVQIHEVGEADGHPYCALEFVEGGNLVGKIKGKPMPAREAARLVEALARAMQLAHSRNVVHRDLKPANVLLAADGTPKVTDFGLARQLDSDSGETQAGAVMGTPSYMAPEQASGRAHEAGPAADVYALGALLYDCLTGQPPFKGKTFVETLDQVRHQEPVPPSRLRPGVPFDLETICLKCLRKEPEQRYASAAELADDLGRFQRGEPIQARPVGATERGLKWVRRNPVVATLAATALLVLMAGVVVSWLYASEANFQASEARSNAKEAHDNAIRANEKTKEATEATGKAREEAERARLAEADALDRLRRAEWAAYTNKLALAQAAFAYDNMPDVFRYLEECQWDLRGWEHDHLRGRFDASRQTLQGHRSVVSSVCFSPDGTRILTGSYDGTAKVWDAARGTEVFTIQARSWVSSVSFSPDGTRLLTGSLNNTAKVWDADKGTEMRTLKGHKNSVTSVCFSPDGTRILTGSLDNTAKVWDAETGQEVHTLKGHTGIIVSVCFSPDGTRILTGSEDRTAKVWDADKGIERLTLQGHTGGVYSAVFSPDGKRILTGSYDMTARLWDAATGQELAVLRGHTGGITSVVFSPDGKRVVTGNGDGTARLWDPQTGRERSSTGRSLVGKCATAVERFDTRTGARLREINPEPRTSFGLRLSGLAFSPDGKSLAVATPPAMNAKPEGNPVVPVTIWNVADGKLLSTIHVPFKDHPADARLQLAYSPDGTSLLFSCGGVATVIELSTPPKFVSLVRPKEVVGAPKTPVALAVRFTPESARIVGRYGGFRQKQSVVMWDRRTGQLVDGPIPDILPHPDPQVRVSPNGRYEVTGSGRDLIDRWAKPPVLVSPSLAP